MPTTRIPFRPLTPAQLRVAQLVAPGLPYRSIASELGIQVRTARQHVQAIGMLLPSDDAVPTYKRVMRWASLALHSEDEPPCA